MSGIIRRKVESTAAKGKSAGASKEETEPESCGVNDQGGRETDEEENDVEESDEEGEDNSEEEEETEEEQESEEEEESYSEEEESDEEDCDFEEEEDDPARGKNRGKKKGNLGAANTSAALAELNEYELQRQRNIERNLEVFQNLGISSIATEVTEVSVAAKKKNRRGSTSYVGLLIDNPFSF